MLIVRWKIGNSVRLTFPPSTHDQLAESVSNHSSTLPRGSDSEGWLELSSRSRGLWILHVFCLNGIRREEPSLKSTF